MDIAVLAKHLMNVSTADELHAVVTFHVAKPMFCNYYGYFLFSRQVQWSIDQRIPPLRFSNMPPEFFKSYYANAEHLDHSPLPEIIANGKPVWMSQLHRRYKPYMRPFLDFGAKDVLYLPQASDGRHGVWMIGSTLTPKEQLQEYYADMKLGIEIQMAILHWYMLANIRFLDDGDNQSLANEADIKLLMMRLEGMRDKQIADILGSTPEGVRKRSSRIMQRLNVRTTTELLSKLGVDYFNRRFNGADQKDQNDD